jgi:hypothetical protein
MRFSSTGSEFRRREIFSGLPIFDDRFGQSNQHGLGQGRNIDLEAPSRFWRGFFVVSSCDRVRGGSDLALLKRVIMAQPENPSIPAADALPVAVVPSVSADSTVIAEPPQPLGKYRRASFLFNIVCGVCTITSLILAVYFYQASKIKPLLTFAVNPLKAELQRPDYDKDLGFVYKGKPVDSDSVTSVQVCVWNAGTGSIKEVLEQIRLVMPDGSAILTAC